MTDTPVVAVESFYQKAVAWVGLHPATVTIILLADIALHVIEIVFKVL